MIDALRTTPWFKRASTLQAAGIAAAIVVTVGVAIQFGPGQEVAASTVAAPRTDPVVADAAKVPAEPRAEIAACQTTNWPYIEKCGSGAVGSALPTRQVRVISTDRTAPTTITVAGVLPAQVLQPQAVAAPAQPLARIAPASQPESMVQAKAKSKPAKAKKEARATPRNSRREEAAIVVASGESYVVRQVGRSDDRGGN